MGKAENKVEDYLNQEIEKLGGETRKYESPGRIGVADRLCLIPMGILYFVEVKTEDGIEEDWQERERKRMMELGFRAIVVYGKEDVDTFINKVKFILFLRSRN